MQTNTVASGQSQECQIQWPFMNEGRRCAPFD